MKRVLGLRVGAAACVAAIGLVWWPTSATAQGQTEVGWWYRGNNTSEGSSSGAAAAPRSAAQAPPTTLPPAPVPFPTIPLPQDPPGVPGAPPPATVPEGGLYVANDAFGPLGIGAVRFGVGQVGESRLTLQFAEGGASAGLLPIVACPLLEGFQQVANGAWRDRPAHDCARAQSLGTVAPDGSISFTLSSAFQQAGQETLDIVLLPEPTNGTPFSVAFEPLDPDALDVVGAAPDRPLPPAQPAFTPDSDARAGSSSGASTGARPGSSESPARPAPGAVPGGGSPTLPTGGPTATPGSTPVQPIVDLFDDRPWARAVASVILGLLALGLAAASTGRLPGLVGAAGAADGHKGVGRFARHREGSPPALT